MVNNMSLEKGNEIVYMILKELRRYDFTELCEHWGLKTSEVEKFLDYGLKYIKEQN